MLPWERPVSLPRLNRRFQAGEKKKKEGEKMALAQLVAKLIWKQIKAKRRVLIVSSSSPQTVTFYNLLFLFFSHWTMVVSRSLFAAHICFILFSTVNNVIAHLRFNQQQQKIPGPLIQQKTMLNMNKQSLVLALDFCRNSRTAFRSDRIFGNSKIHIIQTPVWISD